MHRVRSAGRVLDVLVRDGDFGRLYITYDVTTHARQELIAILIIALGVVAMVAIAGWAAFGISRRLVEPINSLADRLTRIDPGQRHVRVGAEFAGNELERLYRDVRCGGFHPGNDALTHELVGKAVLGILGELLFPDIDVPSWFTSTMLALNVIGTGAVAFTVLASFAKQRNEALAALRAEQARSEALLLNVLPASIAERLKEQGITRVVFDRGGNLYHGRVRAVAESARQAGLEF